MVTDIYINFIFFEYTSYLCSSITVSCIIIMVTVIHINFSFSEQILILVKVHHLGQKNLTICFSGTFFRKNAGGQLFILSFFPFSNKNKVPTMFLKNF